MRFPVFARRSNPSIDRPILRKSKSYVTLQVETGAADWVNPADPAQGIICRELLYFGERTLAVAKQSSDFSPVELPGLRWERPKSDQRPTIGAMRAGWTWDQEAALFFASLPKFPVASQPGSPQAPEVPATHTLASGLAAGA